MSETIFTGIPASEGIAAGPAFCYIPTDLTIPDRCAEAPELEMQRFYDAAQVARHELQGLYELTARRAGEEQAAIFMAHVEMLSDPMLEDLVQTAVGEGQTVEVAVSGSAASLAAMLAGMSDELFAARAADVQDVGCRLMRILLGLPETSLSAMTQPSIVIARDLTPSDTARLDPQLTLGFCTAQGGLTSHSAILARTLGLPAVVGLGEEFVHSLHTGDELLLDGGHGEVVVSPSEETRRRYQALRSEKEARMQAAMAGALEPACTADGRRVEVAANIGEVETARAAIEFGAEGVGLLRTEFLYLNDTNPPAEEKQVAIYRQIFEAIGQRPVIVRTLDIGGDKPPSYVAFEPEMNPFLGWRGVRICLDEIGLFKTQLRAILRAGVGFPVRIMYPMVSGLEELSCAQDIYKEVVAELTAEGLPFAASVPVGIMVETPAAAMLVDVLSEFADFFSLGTNDLTQYTLAVDRGNTKVASLYQPLHPAVLRMVRQTIELAHSKGKWVGMCGEMAGMKKAIPILLGLGLDEFSMAPRAIPEAKQLIRKLNSEEARQIAGHALRLGTAQQVEEYAGAVLADLASRPA